MGGTEGHACVSVVLDESYSGKLDSTVSDSSLLTSGQMQLSFSVYVEL